MYNINKFIYQKKIIVFGVGTNSIYRQFILQEFNDQIIYFVDNNKELWGKTVEGYLVHPVSKISDEKSKDIYILITVKKQEYKEEISRQLSQYGLRQKENFDFISNYETDITKYQIKYLEVKPKHLVMELSSFCNLQCVFCNFHGYENIGEHRNKFASWDVIKEIVRQVNLINSEGGGICDITSFHSGEELLHPEWSEMVQYILNETQIDLFIISTNGMLLNDENINRFLQLKGKKIRLQISLSGYTPEECEWQRKNIIYDVVKKNILKAYDILQRKVEIRINCDYIPEKKFWEEVNGDYSMMQFPIPEYIKNDFPMIPCVTGPTVLFSPDMLPKEYEKICKPVKVQSWKKLCRNIFDLICLDSAGYVLNCCCNGGYQRLGNILEDDMLEIWKESVFMKDAREYMKTQYKRPEWCSNCCNQFGGEFEILIKK